MARSSRSSSAGTTFESIRKQCTAANEYKTTLELSVGAVSCRFSLRRKSARMEIDLLPTLYNIMPDRWRDFARRHDEYVRANFARADWKEMGVQVRPDGLCFDVLREDAEEWFEVIRNRLDAQEGMTGVSPLVRQRGW